MKHLPIQAHDDIRRFSVFFGRFRNFGTAVERPEDPTPSAEELGVRFLWGTDEKISFHRVMDDFRVPRTEASAALIVSHS